MALRRTVDFSVCSAFYLKLRQNGDFQAPYVQNREPEVRYIFNKMICRKSQITTQAHLLEHHSSHYCISIWESTECQRGHAPPKGAGAERGSQHHPPRAALWQANCPC